MKICNQYNHNCALEIIQSKEGIYNELIDFSHLDEVLFGANTPYEIKKRISENFNHKGWADKVRVGNSNLTISFIKSKTGVCFQLGNVARTYADILKLMHLHKKGIIDVGIIYVPHKIESKILGTNYAQYDRLAKELLQFKDIVTVVPVRNIPGSGFEEKIIQ